MLSVAICGKGSTWNAGAGWRQEPLNFSIEESFVGMLLEGATAISMGYGEGSAIKAGGQLQPWGQNDGANLPWLKGPELPWGGPFRYHGPEPLVLLPAHACLIAKGWTLAEIEAAERELHFTLSVQETLFEAELAEPKPPLALRTDGEPALSGQVVYNAGQVVTEEGLTYIAKRKIVGTKPGTDPTAWEESPVSAGTILPVPGLHGGIVWVPLAYNLSMPINAPDLTDIVQVVHAGTHVVVLKSDGTPREAGHILRWGTAGNRLNQSYGPAPRATRGIGSHSQPFTGTVTAASDIITSLGGIGEEHNKVKGATMAYGKGKQPGSIILLPEGTFSIEVSPPGTVFRRKKSQLKGFLNGVQVTFPEINGHSKAGEEVGGLKVGHTYYVVEAAQEGFSVSLTEGGAPVAFTVEVGTRLGASTTLATLIVPAVLTAGTAIAEEHKRELGQHGEEEGALFSPENSAAGTEVKLAGGKGEGLRNGTQVAFTEINGEALAKAKIAGLEIGHSYFIVSEGEAHFQLAATLGGEPITFTALLKSASTSFKITKVGVPYTPARFRWVAPADTRELGELGEEAGPTNHILTTTASTASPSSFIKMTEATANGYVNGERVLAAELNGKASPGKVVGHREAEEGKPEIKGVEVGKSYWIVGATSEGFELAETKGGTPIQFASELKETSRFTLSPVSRPYTPARALIRSITLTRRAKQTYTGQIRAKQGPKEQSAWPGEESAETGAAWASKPFMPEVEGSPVKLTAVDSGGSGFYNHVLGLTTAGEVLAWGADSSGQCGQGGVVFGELSFVLEPTFVLNPAGTAPLKDIISMACGGTTSFFINSSREVFFCGACSNGLGGKKPDEEKLAHVSLPRKLEGLPTTPGELPEAVCCSAGTALILLENGRVMSFGSNVHGELGNGVVGGAGAYSATPTLIPGLTGVTAIAAGRFHLGCIKSDGSGHLWGINNYGQIGNGHSKQNPPDEPVGTPFEANLAGRHAVALTLSEYNSLFLHEGEPLHNPVRPKLIRAGEEGGERAAILQVDFDATTSEHWKLGYNFEAEATVLSLIQAEIERIQAELEEATDLGLSGEEEQELEEEELEFEEEKLEFESAKSRGTKIAILPRELGEKNEEQTKAQAEAKIPVANPCTPRRFRTTFTPPGGFITPNKGYVVTIENEGKTIPGFTMETRAYWLSEYAGEGVVEGEEEGEKEEPVEPPPHEEVEPPTEEFPLLQVVRPGPQGLGVDALVRLQALDGTWETCGADRAIQVVPESIEPTWDESGPKTASFQLKRSAIALWPDLSAFTPVEIEIGGVVVWDGRVEDTPGRTGTEQVINVQCAGWQTQLDDDVYRRPYVHSKLTDWKDMRSMLESDLTIWTSAFQVQTGAGLISLSVPNGSVVVGGSATGVGVVLDMGPGQTAEAISVNLTGCSVGGNYKLFCRCSDTIPGLIGGSSEYSEAFASFDPGAVTTETVTGTFAKPARYVTIFFDRATATATETTDITVRLNAITVFGSTAFESAGVSTLTGDKIITDALATATLLLSGDLSQIHAPETAFSDFVLAQLSTPREAIEAANSLYNWITKLLIGRRFMFAPRPSYPLLELGAWSGSETEDASANQGAEIYNRAVVEGQSGSGEPVVVEAYAGQQPGVKTHSPMSPAAGNPSFATNTATWTTVGGTFTRDTSGADYHSAPACGKWEASKGERLLEAFTGVFHAGEQYLLTFWFKCVSGIIEARFGAGVEAAFSESDYTQHSFFSTGEWEQVTIAWTPSKKSEAAELYLNFRDGHTAYIDDLSIAVAEPTLADRRGFRRTKVIQPSSAITMAEGEQLADIFLQSHLSTPFKGSATATPGGVRKVIGGQPVHPSQLGLHTQELIRLSDRIDPDTGGMGRDATIAEVSYTHADQKANVVLDDKRGNFDALLARLAVVQSVGS